MARGALLPYFEHLPSSPRPYLPATFHPARPRKALTRPVDYKHTSRETDGIQCPPVLCTPDSLLLVEGSLQGLVLLAHVDALGSFHHCSRLCFC